MNDVLWISLAGAGLVILGLMLLWFLMGALVRLTSPKKENDPCDDPDADPDCDATLERQQKAAAASAAVAILLMNSSLLTSGEKMDQRLTPWQSAHRTHRLHNRPAAPNKNRTGT